MIGFILDEIGDSRTPLLMLVLQISEVQLTQIVHLPLSKALQNILEELLCVLPTR